MLKFGKQSSLKQKWEVSLKSSSLFVRMINKNKPSPPLRSSGKGRDKYPPPCTTTPCTTTPTYD